jgi:hypothetical protein
MFPLSPLFAVVIVVFASTIASFYIGVAYNRLSASATMGEPAIAGWIRIPSSL